MQDSIFISYRREDAPGQAGRLYDYLSAHFSRERVFMDVDRIEPGDDFVDSINKAVGSCSVLLVVIGKTWLTCTDGEQRRLDNPHDYVRVEVVAGLKRNIRVIPLTVQGARMPKSEDLPDQLAKLTRLHALEISDGHRWTQDVQTLIQSIERAFSQTRTVPSGPIDPVQSAAPTDRSTRIEQSAQVNEPAPPATRRSKRLTVAGAAATVLIVLMAVIYFLGRRAPHKGELASIDAAAVVATLRQQGRPIGVDVQENKGEIDWESVKNSGISFAYIKATDGDDYVESNFLDNWKGTKSVSVLRGAYTVFRPAADPGKQATRFYQTVEAAQLALKEVRLGELPPVVAVKGFAMDEESGQRLKRLLRTINQQFARVPVIYTTAEFWNAYKDVGDFSEYPLWISETNASQPTNLPAGWATWTFWQFSQSSRVAGIKDDEVDLNTFNGSQQEFLAFSRGERSR